MSWSDPCSSCGYHRADCECNKRVVHTVDIVYGSYSEEGYEVACDKNDDISAVTSKVVRLLNLNFLPMSSAKVKITSTRDFCYG